MAVLGRLKIAPNQRLDLPDLVALDAYSAGDWQGFMQTLVGSSSFIVKGFEVFQPETLVNNPASSVEITIAQSALYWAEAEEGSFYVSLPTDPNQSISLITDTTNYIELSLSLSSRAPDSRAIWDPGANGGTGGELSQVVDTEKYLVINVNRNNTGFSSDKIPVAKIVVNSSNIVTSITDSRNLYFRLGKGGETPDPGYTYPGINTPTGFARTDTPFTMTSPSDPNPFKGSDKNFSTDKEWKDMVMTRIKEVDGGPNWLTPGAGGSLSLGSLYLDSQSGHSLQPQKNVTLAWSKASDGKLRSENAVGATLPVTWRANFGQLEWNLGGTFTSGSDRSYSAYTFEKSVADGQNLYLQLQREADLNSDPAVTWANISGTTASVVSASTGAFTGIAVGDYVRKKSGTLFQYYKVLEIRVSAGTPFPSGTITGIVSDATVQYMLISTHDGPIVGAVDQYRYFRANYSTVDLVASQYGFFDTDYYWIGRRFGNMFYLRDYGDLQPGEEVEVLDDSSTHEHGGAGGELTVEKAQDAVYDPGSGFALKPGGTTTLLTLRRRLLDNTVGTPSNVDNSASLLTYTINAPIGTMNDGDTLWVRLGTAGATLASGVVTNVATDNVWEVRDATDAPLKIYDNRNVFMVARKFTINSVECLIFLDGSMLSLDGAWVNNHLSVEMDLFLKNKTQWSVPFIEGSDGKVGENNTEFFWDNTSGPDTLGQLGVRNFRFSEDTVNVKDVIEQDTPQNVDFVPSLGMYTLKLGSSASTIHIPGDLVVDGVSVSLNTVTLQSDDKLIALGVGNMLDGGFGAGIEIADNTLNATSIDAVNGQDSLLLTFSAPHGYTLGDAVGIDSNVACGGITAGQTNATYIVVSTASSAGEAEVISTTELLLYTGATATTTETVTLAPPTTSVRAFTAPWSIRVGSSSADYTSGIESWAFRVKGISTAPTITPVSGYGIVPTANSTTMLSSRIPFVANDNAGPAGVDTTFDFSANLTWDGTDLSLGGNLVPALDNTYDIGTTALRWKTLHVGPGSVVVHGDNTDTLKVQLRYSGSIGILDTDTASSLQLTTGSNNGIRIDTSGRTSIGANTPGTSRLLLGLNTDTTPVGGMSFGGDVPLFRSAATTLSLGSHFLPETDNTWDLGSSSFRWRTLYATSIALTGAFQVNVSTVKTSTYNITATDMLVRYNTTGGAFTITLPTSVAGNKGQMVIVKDVGGFVGQAGKAMTLAPNGSDTIDGTNASIVVNFAPFVSLTLIADGAGGWVIT
jgi:hypothetical protein